MNGRMILVVDDENSVLDLGRRTERFKEFLEEFQFLCLINNDGRLILEENSVLMILK